MRLVKFFLAAFTVLALSFPKPVGYVNDFAGLLSLSVRQELETELANFEKETTVEIAVVTVKSLEGMTVEDYAVRLFEDWKIGKKDQDNGVLILVAKQERRMRLEVGYGLEPIITDGRAGRIIREQMQPAFRNNDYDGGIKAAVTQIESYIRSGQPPGTEETIKEKTKSTWPLVIIGILILVYISAFLGRSKHFWPGGVIGTIEGGFLGWIVGTLLASIILAISFGLLGLVLDFILSKNYGARKKAGQSTSFWSSWGGFSSGGRNSDGSGFGGFGGGSSGGGGASGGW